MSGLTAWPAALLMLVLAATAAWAQAYLLKPGDTLTITVFQDEKLNRVVVVAPDGRIAFPLAGHFKAGGRTAEAVEAELKFRLKKQYKDEIDITVAITGIKEVPLMPEPQEEKIYPSFYITGGVGKPGQYPFRTQTNVLQALAMAGGLSPLALKGRIKIRREVDGGETFYRFDYEAFLAGRDLSRNISLQDGDVIVVPERDKDAVVDPFFYVTGEVARPGQYYFKTRTTVLQAIALAGGLGPFAADSRIVIRRKVDGQDTLFEFDYDAYTSGEDISGNMGLKSGDVIVVPEKGLFE